MKKIFTIIFGIIALSLLIFWGFIFLKNSETLPQSEDKKVSIVSQSQALTSVKNRIEIIKYEAELKKAGSKASFEVQDDDENWLVHVFEIVKNGDSPSHTATFNWYRVNKKTGAIDVEF